MEKSGYPSLQFGFVNDAAEREYKDLPETVLDEFGKALRCVQHHEKPFLPVQYLNSIDNGVIELKINGSPAYRCVYIAKYANAVVVLHSFEKTTNSVDRKAMALAEKRLKELKLELGIT